MRFHRSWALFVSVMLLASCGGNNNSTSSCLDPGLSTTFPCDVAANVAGNWQLSFTATGFTNGVTASGTVTQGHGSINGTMTLQNAPCAVTGVLDGVVTKNDIQFQLNENGFLVNFTGTVAKDTKSASGTFTTVGANCNSGTGGNWTMTRS